MVQLEHVNMVVTDVDAALDFYQARELLGWDALTNVPAYLDRFLERPAVQRGLNSPKRPE